MSISSEKEYFDVNRIVSIHFKPERVTNDYAWEKSKPIKKFFGLIDTGRFTEEGWEYYYDYAHTFIYSDDDLRRKGYKVYSADERLNSRVCVKACVKIYLTDNNQIEMSFESNEEAEVHIEYLKKLSGTTFAVVIYK